jgi:hypothetical protein
MVPASRAAFTALYALMGLAAAGHRSPVLSANERVFFGAHHPMRTAILSARRPMLRLSYWKHVPHLVIEFREANHVPAAATAVAVEEVFVGIHHEAWLVIPMQRA